MEARFKDTNAVQLLAGECAVYVSDRAMMYLVLKTRGPLEPLCLQQDNRCSHYGVCWKY